MGAFFGSIAIKTDNRDGVVKTIKESGEPMFIAGPIEGWLLLFLSDDFKIPEIAQRFSKEFNTVAVSGQVFDSDDFLFQVYDKGETVFDFIEDKTSGEGISIKTGTVADLSGCTQESFDVTSLEDIFNKSYTFAEEKYQDVVKTLKLPNALGNLWGFDYIDSADDDGRPEEKEKDLPNLEKIF
ncbi:MAG: hypothetical protein HY376_01855 [Candidatus Blackburnbacteria bacterium]|nr:hypothetical protein [Candidatus Blackburnbacteria bacterium]